MPPMSKLTAAIASGHNDLTVAAANLNIDFSLVKVEAPQEYLAVGQQLSKKRRQDAEQGSAHTTAGKLAALFEQVLDPVPHLVRAYGVRVSEISGLSSVNPQESPSAYGIFADAVGLDATTIWAAATTGPAGVPIHLLACMLARHWSPSEATSIWVEIVDKRKIEIMTAFENNEAIPFQAVSAARQELTRSHLADWDASARSWLQTADEAYKLQHRQLALIIHNVNLPVDQSLDPYQGVMNAWKSAMSTLENLIIGMPQRIQSAAALLALSSWHIYPDILVLGPHQKEIKLKDKCVQKGGVLTIGLTYDSPDREQGIHWALSLAHLRYYGLPTTSSRSLEKDSSRISFDELMIVALGSLVRAWGGKRPDILKVAKWLVMLSEELMRPDESGSSEELSQYATNVEMPAAAPPEESCKTRRFSWVLLMTRSASHLLSTEGIDRESALMLAQCGFRNGESFLCLRKPSLISCFGLVDVQVLLQVVTAEGRKELVTYVRQHCGDAHFFCGRSGSSKHISDRQQQSPSDATSWSETPNSPLPGFGCDSECSSASTKKIIILPILDLFKLWKPKAIDSTKLKTYFDEYFTRARKPTAEEGKMKNEPCPSFQLGTRKPTTEESKKKTDSWAQLFWLGTRKPTTEEEKQKTVSWAQRFRLGTSCRSLVKSLHTLSLAADVYKLLPGATVAISVISTKMYTASYYQPASLGLTWFSTDRIDESQETLIEILKDSVVDKFPGSAPRLGDALTKISWYTTPPELDAGARYETSPGSNLSPEQVESLFCNPHSTMWTTERCAALSRGQAFSCLALFDSGYLNISPSLLSNVMAMSSGSSIYVASPLLCDPFEVPAGFEMKRIIGNIGRAGIAMLVPPQNPRLRSSDLGSWNLVLHRNFDGKEFDGFAETSMHLSFSGWDRGLDLHSHRSRDTKAFLLESVVSVHDRGKWVADVDILTALSNSSLTHGSLTSHCPCSVSPTSNAMMNHFRLNNFLLRGPVSCSGPAEHSTGSKSPQQPITDSDDNSVGENQQTCQKVSIDCWEELLQAPDEDCVVRAHKNWLARLAVSCVAHQMGRRVVILPRDVCWNCVEDWKCWQEDERYRSRYLSQKTAPKGVIYIS